MVKNIGHLQSAIGAGNNDFSITLGKNTTVQSVKLAVPGALGDVTYQLFDGVVADAKPITEALYLAAGGSVNLNNLLGDAAGKVGIRVAGLTNTDKKAYVNVEYEV